MSTFLSYNKNDRDTAREVAMFCAADNVTVWFDEWEISAGDSIVWKVDAGLTGCSHFLILWSASATKSTWVRRELESALERALAEGSPRVIPIRLDKTPLPGLLAGISSIQYSGGKEDDRGKIVRAVTGHGPSTSYIRAVVKKYHEVVSKTGPDSTLGLAACPKCGSERIESWTDWEVEPEEGDFGELNYSGTEVPSVRCTECCWQSPGEDLALVFEPPTGTATS
jgi:hypothetical protein